MNKSSGTTIQSVKVFTQLPNGKVTFTDIKVTFTDIKTADNLKFLNEVELL